MKKQFSFPTLSTGKLTLRQLKVSDAKEIFILRSDLNVNKYLDRELSNSIDDAKKFIRIVNENFDKNKSFYWAVCLANSEALVGTVCLFNFSAENNNCEIGFELLPQYQKSGIMREAVKAIINYAFNSLRVGKIQAFTHPENINSQKLLEKMQFKKSASPEPSNIELLYFTLDNNEI